MNDIALDQSRENFPATRRSSLVPTQQPVEPLGHSDQFGIADLIRTFERHKMLVIGIVAALTLATLVWQLTSPNLYRSTASIQVELIDATGTNQADVLARNTQRIANESKLYRS
ncbi:MAG: Wzz/FepE/Etk N-terminal domain-containing protein, partial [Erythrobacter sp.]